MENFANKHHQMQKTRTNYFKSKEHNTNLPHAKIGKHEVRKKNYNTHAYLFSSEERYCYAVSIRNYCFEFIAFYSVYLQSVCRSLFKTPLCGASYCINYTVFRKIISF